MTIDELLELEDEEQAAYLNARVDEGKSADEVYEGLGTTRMDMARYGFFFVGGRFMLKPTRGYARTKPTKLG